MEVIMKKDRRSTARWPAPRPWVRPLNSWMLTEFPKLKRDMANPSSKSNSLENILKRIWAWHMLHKI